MSEVTVLCDNRESQSGVLERLSELGAIVRAGDLDAGDYVLSAKCVVLRKSAEALVSGIIDGRLANQMIKVMLSFEKPILLVQGDLYSTGLHIGRDAIDGALAHLVSIQGVSILHVRNPRNAADLIYRMAKHAQNGQGYETAFRRGKMTQGKAESLFMVSSAPSIGPVSSAKVLMHFRSMYRFVNASVNELMAVPGLGRKKAERIYASIRYELPEGENFTDLGSMFADPVPQESEPSL